MSIIIKTWPIVLAALCFGASSALAADAPAVELIKAEQAVPVAEPKSVANWEFLLKERKWKTDPALSVKVSFTAEREPLGDFLARLSQLGGKHFELPADSPFLKKKLTATATEMPLREVIESLNRLYGFTWDELPDNGGYSAVAIPLNEVEQGIWRFGDLLGWASEEQSMSGPKRKALALAMMQYLNATQIKSPEGQPLSSLPAELQAQVRQTMEWQAALALVDKYTRALLPNLATSVINIERQPVNESTIKNAAGKADPIPSTVTVLDARGRNLALLGQLDLSRPAPLPEPPVPIVTKPFVDEPMAAF